MCAALLKRIIARIISDSNSGGFSKPVVPWKVCTENLLWTLNLPYGGHKSPTTGHEADELILTLKSGFVKIYLILILVRTGLLIFYFGLRIIFLIGFMHATYPVNFILLDFCTLLILYEEYEL
jgi:hypothetical protein